jgi:anti-anti-sigma factor
MAGEPEDEIEAQQSSALGAPLSVLATSDEHGWVMKISGDVDAMSLQPLMDSFGDVLAKRTLRALTVDMSDVGFMDSNGANALVVARREVLARGGTFVVQQASQPVVRVLEMTGLAEVFLTRGD